MKQVLLVPALALGLSGCFQTTSGEPPASLDPFAIWRQAVSITSNLCHFAPDFQAVANLLALGPQMESVNAIVTAVCGAVTGTKALAVKGKPGLTVMSAPTFRGVRITGQRV